MNQQGPMALTLSAILASLTKLHKHNDVIDKRQTDIEVQAGGFPDLVTLLISFLLEGGILGEEGCFFCAGCIFWRFVGTRPGPMNQQGPMASTLSAILASLTKLHKHNDVIDKRQTDMGPFVRLSNDDNWFAGMWYISGMPSSPALSVRSTGIGAACVVRLVKRWSSLLFILFICTDHQVCHLHCHQSSSPLDQVQ
jgi:hypothetical protein